MKITIITSNNSRHNYLINLMSEISSELHVIMECKTIYLGIAPSTYSITKSTEKYFQKVNEAQNKIFGRTYLSNKSKINLLPLAVGDLSKYNFKDLNSFLKSDVYIIFGSSYLKGDLAEFLISKKAINIHMGISPYYRGSDCNFWALYDKNTNYVGSTIQLLSKGLDSGNILYHALSKFHKDPFYYSMNTVKSAIHSLRDRIIDNSIFDIVPQKQNRLEEIRYTKKKEFTDRVINEFLGNLQIPEKKILLNDYKEPYILET